MPPQVTILQCYRKGGAGDYYYSIQSMIEYEQENNLLTCTDPQSGSRTLLRLHRGLGECCGGREREAGGVCWSNFGIQICFALSLVTVAIF